MFSTEREDWCCFRVTAEINQQCNRIIVPPSQIPKQGVCSASDTGFSPCEYPTNSEYCPKKSKQDFCQALWARG